MISETTQIEGVVDDFAVKVGFGVSASVKLDSSHPAMAVNIGNSK